MPQIKENIKKVAIQNHKGSDNQYIPQLIDLDQGRPLAAIIHDVCTYWGLSDPEEYALQFNDKNRRAFITERNRVEIQNGNVLLLTYSSGKTACEIHKCLVSGDTSQRLHSLKQLSELSCDITFAQEFFGKNGFNVVIEMIEGATYHGDFLDFLLRSFVELMEHGLVSWDILQPKFIVTISHIVNRTQKSSDTSNIKALEILESTVLHSPNSFSIVEKEVPAQSLVSHLESSNAEIQKKVLALINILFVKTDPSKRKNFLKNLEIRSMRNIIHGKIIGSRSEVGNEMDHQLYVLQTLMLNLIDERRMTPVETSDQNALKEVADLRKIAFDNELEATLGKRQSHAKDYFKKLGFKNSLNPAEDFSITPPGILALDNMTYFAKTYRENYTKLVLENSCRSDEHDCPFARASIHLTSLLCDILKVGEQPSDEGTVFYPMFFAHNRPIEELFCICIQTMNKTWKEMRAVAGDFDKVVGVVKEQIQRALAKKPLSFEQFRGHLLTLNYNEITQIWQQEQMYKEKSESDAKPILELREQIMPEINELIKQQRLNSLIQGTRFTKYSTKGRMKDKFLFCRLSPNYKTLYYGDCTENASPTVEQLQNKVPVVEIKSLLVGRECPHVKEKDGGRGKKSSQSSLAFSVVLEPKVGDTLNFVASNEKEFCMWTDGINALLGNNMSSELYRSDLEMLINMDIKIRLLDVDGLTIPNEPPPIPREPPDYNFPSTARA